MPKTSQTEGSSTSSPGFPPPGLISQSWLLSVLGTEFWRIGTSDHKAEAMLNWAFHELALLGILRQERIFWDGPRPEGIASIPMAINARTQVTFGRLEEVVMEHFLKLHPNRDEAETMTGILFYNLRHLHLIDEDRVVWREVEQPEEL